MSNAGSGDDAEHEAHLPCVTSSPPPVDAVAQTSSSKTNPAPSVVQTTAGRSSEGLNRSRYFIRFVGNNSKRWDGKEIELQGEWVENLYTEDELKIGNELTLPWPGKGGNVTNWNAVVVDGSGKKAEKIAEKKAEAGNRKRKAPSATPKKKKVEKKKGRIICIGEETATSTSTSSSTSGSSGLQSSAQSNKNKFGPGVCSHSAKSTTTTSGCSGLQSTQISQLIEQQGQIVSLLTTLVQQRTSSVPHHQQPDIQTSPERPQIQPRTRQSFSPSPQPSSSISQPFFSSPQLHASQLQAPPQSTALAPPLQPLFGLPQPSAPSPQIQSMTPPIGRPQFPSQPLVSSPQPQSMSQPLFGASQQPAQPQSAQQPAQPKPAQLQSFQHQPQPFQHQPFQHQTQPFQHQPTSPQFLQPSVRRPAVDVSVSIDDLLSDDYSWNTTGDDSDYMTSVTYLSDSEQPYRAARGGGSNTGGASNNETVKLTNIPPPPFPTPPKLTPVEQVMQNNPGSDVASLRNLTTSLAKEAIFGREELAKCSLSGRKNTGTLSAEKLNYIKTLVQSTVPNRSNVEFEHIWTLCRNSISKSCQTLRSSARKRL